MTPVTGERLPLAAQRLAALLDQRRDVQIVLAESCTAGLAVASLGAIPGISRYLCGSQVTYQIPSKIAWLKVDPSLTVDGEAVNPELTAAMASAVLAQTPHATHSGAVTGHLGPNAPAGLDGVVFVGIANRKNSKIVTGSVQRISLSSLDRISRQQEAAAALLEHLIEALA